MIWNVETGLTTDSCLAKCRQEGAATFNFHSSGTGGCRCYSKVQASSITLEGVGWKFCEIPKYATCGTDGTFNTLTCAPNTCTPTGNIVNSNKAAASSIKGTTGQTVTVTCDVGYSGGGIATCGTNGNFNTLTCVAKPCKPTNVANSNKAKTESITGTTTQVVQVTCDAGYSGTGTTVCQADGTFTTFQCVECVLGKYNDAPEQPLCKDNCDAGSHILQDKSSCELCPYGHWQDENDKSSCKKCSAGKISKKAGQTSDSTCEKCVVGLYNPYEGHDSSCMPCPTAAETGASECAGW